MAWTLTHDGITKSFADWGLKNLRRSHASQVVSVASFEQSGASFDGEPLFPIDSVVTISNDAGVWHTGPVILAPREATTRSESLLYQVACPWWYLENLPYEQTVYTGAGVSATPTTNVVMFSSIVSGAVVSSNVEAVIASAVAQAVAAGASMQVAFVGDFNLTPPLQGMRDPMCAEVIRAALKFAPDATSMQFDDGTGNTVSIAMPAANANLTWPTGTGTILSTSNVASGVATWLAAPTIANLNGAVSDADLAQLAANSFTATQTITKSSPTLSAPQLKIVGYGVNIVITDDDGSTVRAYTDIGRWFAKDYNDGSQTMSMGRDGAGGMGFGASSRLVWSPNAQWWDGSPDVSLGRDGAGILSQHNGTTPQRWQVANTHASGTSLEAWVVDWQTTANTCRVGTIKGSGGGTARQMILQTDGTERIRISASGEIFMTLPTSAGTTGSLWNDSGTVKVAP